MNQQTKQQFSDAFLLEWGDTLGKACEFELRKNKINDLEKL